MQLKITRLPSEDRSYSIVTGKGTRYGVHDTELKRWLVNLGVEDSVIAAVLKIEPNKSTTLHVPKAA